MAFNPNLLTQALADPTIAAMSDADAATALSAPILAPRTTPVTFSTCASVWGFAAAATFRAALDAGAAGSDAALAALSKLAVSTLGGAGIDATDSQSIAAAQQFVAAGLCTQQQMNGVMYLPVTYRCGGTVATSDVTAARASIAFASVKLAKIQAGALVWNAWSAAVNAATSAGQLPAAATLPGGT